MMVRMVRGNHDAYVGAPGQFSWLCFFFGGAYAVVTGNWKLFWVYMMLHVALFFAALVASAAIGDAAAGLSVIFYFVGFVSHVLVCFEANRWRVAQMEDRAWRVHQ